jgi:hypothetical protein
MFCFETVFVVLLIEEDTNSMIMVAVVDYFDRRTGALPFAVHVEHV